MSKNTTSKFLEVQQLDDIDEGAEVVELNSCQSSEPEMGNDTKGQAGYLNTDCNFGESEINIANVKANSFKIIGNY